MTMTILPGGPMITPQYPLLLTVPELSAYLGIKIKTLYAKIEAGEIPHYRLGRLIRFRLDEINAWLEGCRKDISQTTGQSKSRKRKKPSPRSNDHVSAIIAKTIDGEREKYYASEYGKSDRIEGLRKEVNNGTI
jgi:excisionase family DNA binding protein